MLPQWCESHGYSARAGLPRKMLVAAALVVGPAVDEEICEGLTELASGGEMPNGMGHLNALGNGPHGGQRLEAEHLLTTFHCTIQKGKNRALIMCLVHQCQPEGGHGPLSNNNGLEARLMAAKKRTENALECALKQTGPGPGGPSQPP